MSVPLGDEIMTDLLLVSIFLTIRVSIMVAFLWNCVLPVPMPKTAASISSLLQYHC